MWNGLRWSAAVTSDVRLSGRRKFQVCWFCQKHSFDHEVGGMFFCSYKGVSVSLFITYSALIDAGVFIFS